MNSNGKIQKKQIDILILNIGLIVILSILAYVSWDDYKIIEKWTTYISYVSISMLIIQLFTLRFCKYNYRDFQFWFIISIYLFMYGRIYVNWLGLDNEIFWNLIVRYDKRIMFHTATYITIMIQAFTIGFILKNNNRDTVNSIITEAQEDIQLYNLGLILFLVSFPFRVFCDFTSILQAQTSNSYLGISGISGAYDDIAFLFLPSIFYLCASGRIKKVFRIIMGIVLYFSFVMMLSGDRRYQMCAIISSIIFYLAYTNKDTVVRIRSLIVVIPIAYFLLNLVFIIREIRATELNTIFFFIIDNFSKIIFNGSIIVETLSEFGLSFFSVNNIFINVPTVYPFQFGKGIIISFLSVLPIGWIDFFSDLFKKASLSTAINEQMGIHVGATLIGDIYANFGWLSIIVGILFGICFSSIFNNKRRLKNRFNFAQYYAVFYILLNTVRANFFEIIRPIFIILIFPKVFLWIINRRRK